jgi:hypothetical protein
MDQQQLKIWFAGFYEGEGSISNDKSNRNRFRMNISQNDRTPLDIGKKIWGGFIRERIRKSPASNKICKGYEWQLNHNQSIKFIEDIRPFMIIPYKIKQIEKCEEQSKQVWDTRFKCSFCELDFADLSGRRRHEKINHIEKGQLHKCIHCENKYNSLDSMKRHIKINHNSVASICNEQMQHTL